MALPSGAVFVYEGFMKRLLTFIIVACAALGLAACGGVEDTQAEGISVVATTFAPYDFARELVGDNGSVSMLLPPGSETHSYEPTPKDILEIQNADVFIYVSGESDAWVTDVLESVGEGVRAVTLMDCVELLEEETVEGMQAEEHEHEENGHGHEAEYDEHVWTSPRNAALICEKIAAALCEADPENAGEYNANLASYRAELAKLDAAFTAIVADGARKTIIFADRFPLLYFARAYGLTYYAAFPGCSEDAEPSAATVAFIIDKVREEDIPVVFHVELANEDMADIVCDETGAVKRKFNACHNVTRAQFNAGVTYLELMWENTEVLKEALA